MFYILCVWSGYCRFLCSCGKACLFHGYLFGRQVETLYQFIFYYLGTAPIVAPFLGGYLQKAFGWQASFYLLGMLPLVILALTLKYGGESAKYFQPLRVKPLLGVYGSLLTTKDFALALVLLGLNYGMVLLFGMASPFIIEHQWHQTPVVPAIVPYFQELQ